MKEAYVEPIIETLAVMADILTGSNTLDLGDDPLSNATDPTTGEVNLGDDF
jgi:hypothetical protein